MDLKEVILKAWSDPAFKRDLLADPKTVIEQAIGVTLPSEVTIYLHEETDTEIHLVLPRQPPTAKGGREGDAFATTS